MDLTKYYGEEGIVVNKDYAFKKGKDLNDLIAEMSNHGLMVSDLDLSGQLTRVRVGEGAGGKADKSNQRSGWYCVNELSGNYFAVFGNWRTGSEHKWSSISPNTLSESEGARLKQQMAEAQKRRDEAQKQRNEEVANEVKLTFGSLSNTTEHEYLTNKKVKSYGLKIDQNGCLVIPVYSSTGELRSLQLIDKSGQKRFKAGSEIKGNIFLIGADFHSLRNIQQMCICEGYATAATIWEATGIPVACVFSANFGQDAINNLRKETDAKFYLCFDRDSNGVGERKAQDICSTTYNCFMRIPSLYGDYNDIYIEHGLEKVKLEILQQGIGLSQYAIRHLVHDPPPREWLVDNFLERRKPVILSSVGGVGKSMLTLDLALKVANGGGNWFGHPVKRQGNVVVISAEDDQLELARRLKALDPDGKRYDTKYDIFAYTIPDAPKPLTLIKEDSSGLNITQQANELMEELETIKDLELVIIDPIQAVTSASTSSNESAQLYCQLAASISSRMECVCISIHHMSKVALANGDDPLLARAAVRGASSFIDGHRLAIALWLGDEAEAERICLENGVEFDRLRVVRAGVVKANSSEVDMSIKTMFRKHAVLEPYVDSAFSLEGF